MPKHHSNSKSTGSTSLRNVRKFFPAVTKVRDAAKSVDLEVTSADDKTSRKLDHAGCAMAVAGKRTFSADGMVISRKVAYVVKGTEAIRYSLPEHVTREIVSFDRDAGFTPGVYRLNVPKRKIGDSYGSQTGHGRAGGPHIKYHVTTRVRTMLSSRDA